MSTGEAPFNPLDKMTLGLTVAKAMLDRPAQIVEDKEAVQSDTDTVP
jgi:hypothetical protein